MPFLMCLWSDYKYRTACLQGTLEICYCSNISFRKMAHTQWFVPWEGLSKGLSDEKTEVTCSASKQLSFIVFSLSRYHCASSFILVAGVKDRILRHPESSPACAEALDYITSNYFGSFGFLYLSSGCQSWKHHKLDFPEAVSPQSLLFQW